MHIYTQTIHRTTQLIWEECGSCLVFASYTLAFALQLRKKHGKTSVRVVSLFTIRLNTHKFYVLPTQCIYVFCVDLRTNSDYFPIQHQLTGFYNRDGVCLLRGTDWIFIYRQFNFQQFYVLPTQCIYVFCVDLRTNSDYFPIQH